MKDRDERVLIKKPQGSGYYFDYPAKKNSCVSSIVSIVIKSVFVIMGFEVFDIQKKKKQGEG